MRFIDDLITKVRRQETPFYRRLHRLYKLTMQAEVPSSAPVWQPLYFALKGATQARQAVLGAVYYKPMFRSMCESCGRNLEMPLGVPFVSGDLRIQVGDDVYINGRNSFIAGKVYDRPTLRIGDRTVLGFGVVIVVGREVVLGRSVLIAEDCFITDNPGHPTEPSRRRRDEPVDPEKIRPVHLEDDVWIGTKSLIMPGVTIGRGSVIGAGSVVTKSIPPYSLAAGNPARVLRAIEDDEDKKTLTDEMD